MMVYLRGVTGSKDEARERQRMAVFRYVEEHPGCSSTEVAMDVLRAPEEGGMEMRELAYRRLTELEERGLVRSEAPESRRGRPHRWWVAGQS